MGIGESTDTGNAANGRIYVNDVATGTERATSGAFGTVYYFSEEITVAAGDEVQLYGKKGGAEGVLVSYFGAAGYLGREYIEAIS